MESLTTETPKPGGRRVLLARVIESEIDLASGIVIERVEDPGRPRRRVVRSLVLVAALAGLSSGLAAGWVPSARPSGRSPEIVGTGVQVSKLRSTSPCTRDVRDVLVCGVTPDGIGEGVLHE